MTYLRCVLYLTQKACRGSAKLDSHSDTITSLKAHNHPLSEYTAELYLLKSKCLIAARTSRDRQSKVFKQVVRDDPAATIRSRGHLFRWDILHSPFAILSTVDSLCMFWAPCTPYD